MTELFRREAVRHATRRLEGEVILATPLSVKTLGLFLAAVIFAAAGVPVQRDLRPQGHGHGPARA